MKKEVEKRFNEIAMEYALRYPLDSLVSSLIYRFSQKVYGKVLDAGCGPGYTTHLLTNHGFEVVGLDISIEMIRLARKNFPNLDFCHGDIRTLKFEDSYFDGIFCYQVFLYIAPEYQAQSLQEMYRVLKKGGILMINTKNLYYPRNFLSSLVSKIDEPLVRFGEVGEDGKTKTYRYYSSPHEFKRILRGAGFTIENSREHIFSNWIQVWAKKDNI